MTNHVIKLSENRKFPHISPSSLCWPNSHHFRFLYSMDQAGWMREKLVAIVGGGWAVGEFCPIFGEICDENVRFYNQIETHFVCLVSSICHVRGCNRCDHGRVLIMWQACQQQDTKYFVSCFYNRSPS